MTLVRTNPRWPSAQTYPSRSLYVSVCAFDSCVRTKGVSVGTSRRKDTTAKRFDPLLLPPRSPSLTVSSTVSVESADGCPIPVPNKTTEKEGQNTCNSRECPELEPPSTSPANDSERGTSSTRRPMERDPAGTESWRTAKRPTDETSALSREITTRSHGRVGTYLVDGS